MSVEGNDIVYQSLHSCILNSMNIIRFNARTAIITSSPKRVISFVLTKMKASSIQYTSI